MLNLPGPMMHLRPRCGTCSFETSDSNCIPHSPPLFYQEHYCCCSVSQSCLVLWHPMDCSTPGFPVHHQLPQLAQTQVHQVGDTTSHLILCRPLLLLPSLLLSIKVFSTESVLHIRCPKYWIFSFSISPSSEYSRLISFKIHLV